MADPDLLPRWPKCGPDEDRGFQECLQFCINIASEITRQEGRSKSAIHGNKIVEAFELMKPIVRH